ncbi:hypothetical protein J7F02_33110 [Streptomyces sp. ISL-112]|uniref:hypothetical protein n=1 Tax=unclassified Streptomyces TaxID=2593676 RepID=UPI001BEC536B|nr:MULTISPECIES: hypothetical protein [unclassified Streptomyces]MBT2430301.1 hypothetical protein [Streptomyces sp. ISL-112]MBT2466275.1 hypothetical protein [Streptomyces sp. ISL-63]
MIDPIRRGRLQLPSGQFHGTSFNIVPAGVLDDPGGHVAVRLSAVLAAFVLVWTVACGTTADAAQSAFVVTLLGFTWHANVYVRWAQRR